MSELNLSLVFLFALSVITLLITPGPVTLLVARAGLVGGMRHAFATICGTNLASLVLIFLSALLIKGLLVIDESAFKLVRVAGCLYIVWIAWGMIRDAWVMDAQPGRAMTAEPATGSQQGGFSQGFILGVSNPKDIIFFASFLPQFMGVLPAPSHSLAVLTVVWMVLDFSMLGLIALLVRSLISPAREKRILLVASCLLLAIGVAGLGYGLYDLLA
ncbi:LysE family translocator [Comamonas koreensis]|uniref:LysE family translocator n=1 Tax=Comamonas koreensis TaxID=160825 RepID=UPI0015FC3246|nr:LysE family translocator [Comamonas koreensis]